MMPSRGLLKYGSRCQLTSSVKQVRPASTKAKIVLPSKRFIQEIGKTFNPPVSARKIDNDIDKLVNDPGLQPEKLRSLFGNGRNLIAYQRIIERSLLEDPQRRSWQDMSTTYDTIFRAALKVNNQLAISRQCMIDLIAGDKEQKNKALKALELLRESNLPAAYFISGTLYADNNQLDQATFEFKRAISASKAHVDGKLKDDTEFYDYDREIDYSNIVRCNFMLGKICEQNQDLVGARDHYREALAMLDISKEMLPPMEVMATNFLATLAEWENNHKAAHYYALKSAMRANMYGLSAMTKYAQRHEHDPAWAEVWACNYQIQHLINRKLKVAIISPRFTPAAVIINHSRNNTHPAPAPAA